MPYQPNPFVEIRRLNKLDILSTIQKNPRIEETQLVAIFSLKTGLKTITIREMLRELKEAGVIVVDTNEQVRANVKDGDERSGQEPKQHNTKPVRGNNKHNDANRQKTLPETNGS